MKYTHRNVYKTSKFVQCFVTNARTKHKLHSGKLCIFDIWQLSCITKSHYNDIHLLEMARSIHLIHGRIFRQELPGIKNFIMSPVNDAPKKLWRGSETQHGFVSHWCCTSSTSHPLESDSAISYLQNSKLES